MNILNNILKILKKSNNLNNIKIWIKDKINLLDQLSNLLNSWIPIINSFKIILYQTKKKNIRNLIKNILNQLNNWDRLNDCFSKYPKIFNSFDLSIIEMWEVTWKLWDSIDTIKTKEEKSKELKWKILWALIYPIVIITLSIIMILIFMIYVIPKITDMYKDANVNLPKLTQFVIDSSDFLQKNIFIIILLIIWLIILIITFKTNKKTKFYYDKFILKIPIFWALIQRKILALFSSSMWTLLKNWIIINKALDITSKALENDYYEKELINISLWISKWIELSNLMWVNNIQSWKQNTLFHIELSSIIKIWEQTWKLPDLLVKISKKYNKEIDSVVKNISTAIEPIVIIIVWLMIWTLIMAIMLPFFNMVNVI